MECMLGLKKQNVFLLLFAPTQGAHLLIATLCGYKGVTDAVTEIELNSFIVYLFSSLHSDTCLMAGFETGRALKPV